MVSDRFREIVRHQRAHQVQQVTAVTVGNATSIHQLSDDQLAGIIGRAIGKPDIRACELSDEMLREIAAGRFEFRP